MTAVLLKGVRRGFLGRTVLAIDEMSLPEGEFFMLVGPSGSGKTTLLRILAGLVRPDACTVALFGEDALPRAPHERDIGVVRRDHHDLAENLGPGRLLVVIILIVVILIVPVVLVIIRVDAVGSLILVLRRRRHRLDQCHEDHEPRGSPGGVPHSSHHASPRPR